MNVRSILAPALAIALCGCANSLLYDENRDNQGKAAVKAVEEAHLTATVESMNKAFTDMASREEASARARVEQQFEWEVTDLSQAKSLDAEANFLNLDLESESVLDAAATAAPTADPAAEEDVDGLATVLQKRLRELGLRDASTKNLKALADKPTEILSGQKALAGKRGAFLGSFGVRFDNCTDVYIASSDPANRNDSLSETTKKKVNPVIQGNAASFFKLLVKDCKQIDDTRDEWVKLFKTGEIRELSRVLKAQSIAAQAYEKQKAEVAKTLADKKNEAEPFIKAAKPGKPRMEEVKKKADEVIAAIAQARQLNNAMNDVAGAEVFAADKLKDLEAIVNAIAGAPVDGTVKLSTDQQLTIGAVRGIIELGDEAHTLFADAGKPRLVPLLAAIDYQKLILEKIEAVRKIEQKRAGLIANQLQAALDESAAAAQVLSAIKKHNWADRSIAKLNTDLRGDDKRLYYEMLGVYGDAVKEARVSQAVLRSRAETAIYEKNLVNSRYAAAQWDALLDMTAKVLADYHTAGIKMSDLAEFFKALGLVTIGVGTAQ